VMNVSIATVAEDAGTTVTGIQGAITAYTLVMAALMLTGAKIGAIIGRKRAFAIGCVIYGSLRSGGLPHTGWSQPRVPSPSQSAPDRRLLHDVQAQRPACSRIPLPSIALGGFYRLPG